MSIVHHPISSRQRRLCRAASQPCPALLTALTALAWLGCASAVPSNVFVIPPAGVPALDRASLDKALTAIDQVAQQQGFQQVKTPPQLAQIANHYATMIELARYQKVDQQSDVLLLVGLDKRSGALQINVRDLRGRASTSFLRGVNDRLASALASTLPQATIQTR